MWVQLAVVDVMGTVVEDDDVVTGALGDTLLELGVHADREELRHLAGLRKKFAIREVLRRRGDQPTAHALQGASARFDVHALDRVRAGGAELVHGARDALAVLRARGVRVALSTSLSRRVLEEVLHRVGLRFGRDFDVAIAGDDLARARPNPDAIEHAMWSVGVDDCARVCKVGDSVADMREGRAARVGMLVGVASGSASRLELDRAGARCVLPSVASLPTLLLLGRESAARPTGAMPMLMAG